MEENQDINGINETNTDNNQIKRGKGRPKGTFRLPMNPNDNTPPKPKKDNIIPYDRIPVLRECLRYALDNHTTMGEFIIWAEEKFGLTRRQAHEHWQATFNLLKKKYSYDRNTVILKHLDLYWELHKKAMDNQDLNTARQTLNDIAKLMGLNEPEKVEIKGTSIKLNFGGEDTNE